MFEWHCKKKEEDLRIPAMQWMLCTLVIIETLISDVIVIVTHLKF
jgi:hypothetical protein